MFSFRRKYKQHVVDYSGGRGIINIVFEVIF
jgi:hypothetical protein